VEAPATCSGIGGGMMARSFSKAFYKSRQWEEVRTFVLMRDRYICQRCGRPAQEVHHKIHLSPENIWDPKITLNPDNLISLCKECHFAQHVRDKEAGKRHKHGLSEGDCAEGYHFDASGQIVPD
jgi:hypothetical protein